ncbi:acylase [Aquabacterium sp. A7-Y]|uniref:acylase n=1 Tax=Aquabacterium sp. A7-Y TaxID=1349605 RepID=UPI00223DC3D2|nr:acylase [Aquabacterium sp. A7-Y]MCW7540208.1 acylase [Aquabacterium sp. A7-Y]
MRIPSAPLALLGSALLLAGCAGFDRSPGRTAQIQRTAHGVAHIVAPDYEALAYGVAYAHAQDNVCQTANHLVTVRGERSRFFGPAARGELARRMLPNEQIDVFIRAHMDDARLQQALRAASPAAQAMARGYVAGYNRYLRDHATQLPKACAEQPWVRPMTLSDYLRLTEQTMVQAGVGALADAVVTARPPVSGSAQAPLPPLDDAVAALDEHELREPAIGSNGWAFGKDSTRNGRGALLGNPHFPWRGVNRFWQMHLTIPGELDVMGAATGHGALVNIGFNKDFAWTHTVSTGRRFTLHELSLVPGRPTHYLVDGQPEAMQARTVRYEALVDGRIESREHTVWTTRHGPVLVIPKAGLAWTGETAYAIRDANTANQRSADAWLGLGKARTVQDARAALARLGIPWVNTIAADREGNALYADASVVPDVDAAQLQRCAASPRAAALFAAAGLPVLDGSRSECAWRQDPASPVPGLTPLERLPLLVRKDWVQNSNDSYWLSNPAAPITGISPMVGSAGTLQRPRTRAALVEIPAMLAAAGGRIDAAALREQLFRNRNHTGHLVMDELLAACPQAPAGHAQQACAALREWDRHSNVESKGAHLFREFWRTAHKLPRLWRVPFDPADPVNTPRGLHLADASVRAGLWEALDKAAAASKAHGIPLDAPLGAVQADNTPHGRAAIHGGDEFEGVLNKIETKATNGLGAGGYDIDYGTSYVQSVEFDDRGPVAHALLVYGQSSQPGATHDRDQLMLYAVKQWPRLPFHPDEVARDRVGPVLTLQLE